MNPGPPAGAAAVPGAVLVTTPCTCPLPFEVCGDFWGYLETILQLLFGCGLALCGEVIASSDVTDMSTLAKAEKLKTELTKGKAFDE